MRREESDRKNRAATRPGVTIVFILAAALAPGCSSSDSDAQFGSGGAGAGAGANGATGGSGGQTGIGSDGGPIFMDGSTEAEQPIKECAKSTAKASLLPTYLQFLVDVSGSMNCKPTDPPSKGCQPGDPGSKWMLTRSALGSAIDLLPVSSSAGAILFPDVDPSGWNQLCFSNKSAVPMAPLTDGHKTLFKQVLNSTMAMGATPTEDAYLFAVQSFGAITEESNKFIVLITDGVPSVSKGCQGDGMTPVPTAPLVQAAAGAKAMGIKTFVIGSPGSEAVRTPLSEMASQGGTATPGCSDSGPNYCHLDMTTQSNFGQAITDALLEVAGKTIACSFALPEEDGDAGKVDPNLVNVMYTPG
ncbi:MAG TPA: vWA domain-containing protein, partial [Polyangiaceae bacterium]|nr:vWA domain-containing protein [Polyangiaceae bacterium]